MPVERRPIPMQIVWLFLTFAGFVLLSALLGRWLA